MKTRELFFAFLAIGFSILYGTDTTSAVTFTEDTVIDSGDSTYDAQDIVVDGCTLTVNGEHTFNSLTVLNDSVVTHSQYASDTDRLDLTITGDLTVEAGGSINVDGRGYGSDSGLGAGVGSGNGGGGGYGGRGGNGWSAGGSTYGSLTEPTDLGSGGGHGLYGGPMRAAGGKGGGAISLTVGGVLTLEGEISSDGTNGGRGNVMTAYWSGGGGSGGSIYLNVGTLAGDGVISADGGNGGWTSRAGGGGGGRIALHYDTYTFTGALSAEGGEGKQCGGAGTIYKKAPIQEHGELMVDNGGRSGADTPLPESETTLDEMEIVGKAKLKLADASVLVLASDTLMLERNGELILHGQVLSSESASGEFTRVEILSGARLTVNEGGKLDCAKLEVGSSGTVVLNNGDNVESDQVEVLSDGTFLLNASAAFQEMHIGSGGLLTHSPKQAGFDLTTSGDLTVDAGGSINVDGRGYGSDDGPGAGVGSLNGGGGGYGGRGGNGSSAGGATYGSLTEPTDLGSGGGSGSWAWFRVDGGTAGGAIMLSVDGVLTLQGEISADGTNGGRAADPWGGRWSGGGGSGGSVYLNVGTLVGDGVISADGGNGGWTSRAGGGGGGRIAMYYDTYAFTGKISAKGGDGREDGGAGTGYSTPEDGMLELNKQIVGSIEIPCSVKNWEFSAVAGQQVRLEQASMSAPGVVFDLTGPNGWIGFTGIDDPSPLLTLPESGSYTLAARGTGDANNIFYSLRLQETVLTDLVPGVPYNGAFAGSGQAQLFRVEIPEGNPMRIILDDVAAGNFNELYVKFGAPPTRGDYDYRFSNLASSDQSVEVSMATPGVWYILVYGDTISTPSDYSLLAETSSIFVYSVTPDHHGSSADAVLTVIGAGFDRTTQVELVDADGTRYAADAIEVDSFTQLTATYTAGAAPANTYSLVASKANGDSDELSNAFEMTDGVGAKLETNLILPSRVGYHTVSTIWVEYANRGDVAMAAPLLVLSARQRGRPGAIMKQTDVMPPSGFWTSAMPRDFAGTIQLVAMGDTPRVLQPGESFRVPVQYAGWQKPWDFSYSPITFRLGALEASNETPVDWESLKDQMRPEDITDEVWAPLWSNFVSEAGNTWGDYVKMLTDNAGYLERLGQPVTGVRELLQFEFVQADALNIIRTLAASTDAHSEAPGLHLSFRRFYPQHISSRYTLGPLGRGWSHNWNVSLKVLDDGTVTVYESNGSRRIFQPDSRHSGNYFAMPGDHGRLIKLGDGSFTLQAPNGLLRKFRADGKLEYIEDTNRNRITADYSGELLTALSHSDGQSLHITHNAAGLIEMITDPDGRQTRFSYDAGNEHLVSVRYFDGSTITYDYSIGTGVPREHALTEIEFPGASHQYFTYDARGRLATSSRDGGAEAISFSYGTAGMVAVSDAFGNTAKCFLGRRGLLVKAIDPQGDAVRLTFDDDYNLLKITDPAGRRYLYDHDDHGNVVNATDPLGNGTLFAYTGPFNRLTRLMDANGNVTNYDYDNKGNLTSIRYDDGTVESWTYDDQGNSISWTNRRGKTIMYRYDAGRLTAKIYPDNSQVDYIHDNRGNLISATDATGTTTLEYDADDRLMKITYPGGRFLEYTYNAAGQRASSLNQLGHRLDYHYDATARLERITDETGAEIVHYHYDTNGRLVRKSLGNGVYTTYKYDGAWQLIELINYKPDSTILSQFLYTYDSRGRRTSMTTLEGRWDYEHDDLGQLVAWTAPDGRHVEYKYDALGNRITVTEDGSVTEYTTNNMNQYTQVGDTTYEYDADGNLIRKISPLGMSTYTYNDENRLVAVSSSQGNWVYTYDAFGDRVRVDDNGTATDFVIDPIGFGNIVAEYDHDTHDLINHYDHGLGLISRRDATGSPSFYSFNAIGSTSELTSNLGMILNTYSYLPFGEQRSAAEIVDNSFRFVGEYGVMREYNGLYFMRARYYDSGMGRLVSMDPIGLTGGDQDLYRYVANSPLNSIDPLGLQWVGEPANEAMQKFFAQDAACHLNSFGCNVATIAGALRDWISPKAPGNSNKSPGDTPGDTGGGTPGDAPDGRPTVRPPIPPIGGAGQTLPPVGTGDPNEKAGPTGFAEQHFIAGNSLLPYRVSFENEEDATAPAQIVTITDPLDENLDWLTFELTEIGFGDKRIAVPANTQHFETTVPISYNEVDFEVQIEAGIHLATGEVYANFYSIDPLTDLPPTVDIGFLPPADGTGRGQGYFTYTIKSKEGLATGAEIRNVASITFDGQNPIHTNQVDPHDPSKGTDPAKECLNTIDATPPEIKVVGIQETPEHEVVMLDASGSSDPDDPDRPLTYAWRQVSGAPALSPIGMTTAVLSFTPDFVDGLEVLVFEVKVSDHCWTATDQVSVTVLDDDDAGPTIEIIGPDTVGHSQQITFRARVADPKGVLDNESPAQSVYVTWQAGDASGSVDMDAQAGPGVYASDTPIGPFPPDTIVSWAVIAWDADETPKQSRADAITRVINHPPVAIAGEGQTVNENTAVSLDGTGSSDPDGDDLTYQWTQISGTPVLSRSGMNTATPSFTLPYVDGQETLVFELEVYDGFDASTGRVPLTVNDDDDAGPTIADMEPADVSDDQQILLRARITDPKGIQDNGSATESVYASYVVYDQTKASLENQGGDLDMNETMEAGVYEAETPIGPLEKGTTIHWTIHASDNDETPKETQQPWVTLVVPFMPEILVKGFSIQPNRGSPEKGKLSAQVDINARPSDVQMPGNMSLAVSNKAVLGAAGEASNPTGKTWDIPFEQKKDGMYDYRGPIEDDMAKASLKYAANTSHSKLKVQLQGDMTGIVDSEKPVELGLAAGDLQASSVFHLVPTKNGGGKYKLADDNYDVSLKVMKVVLSPDRKGRPDMDKFQITGMINGFPQNLEGKWPLELLAQIELVEITESLPQESWSDKRGIRRKSDEGKIKTFALRPDGKFQLKGANLTLGEIDNAVTIRLKITGSDGVALFDDTVTLKMEERGGRWRY